MLLWTLLRFAALILASSTTFFLWVLIGEELEYRSFLHAPSTLSLYQTKYVCRANGSTTLRVEEEDDDAGTDSPILNCGECGACSNPNDIQVYNKTAQTLTGIMTMCAFEGYFYGDQHTKECLQKASNLTGPCAKCWVDNAICNKKYCQKVCLHHKILPFLPTFRPDWDHTLDPCIVCDERFCGPGFVACSGANRRRVGVVSDLQRNMNLEMCNVTDWDYIWNGDDHDENSAEEAETELWACAADASEIQPIESTQSLAFETCNASNTTILDMDGVFAELSPSTQVEIVNSINIPRNVIKVYLQFDLEEQCDWGHNNKNDDVDQFYVRIGDSYLDPGLFRADVQEYADNKFDLGYYQTIVGIIKSSNETSNTLLFDIPEDAYETTDDSTQTLVWGVRLSDESSGCLAVSNIKVWSACQSTTCSDSDEWDIEAGDFTGGVWNNWVGENDTPLTTSRVCGGVDVLGPFGAINGAISHTIDTPNPQPEHIELTLTVVLTSSDAPVSFDVEITARNGEKIALLPVVLGGFPVGVSVGGVTAHMKEALGYSAPCKAYDVVISIPQNVNVKDNLKMTLIYIESGGELSVSSYAFSTKCPHSALPIGFPMKGSPVGDAHIISDEL